ncbi:hypothetical protein PUN28_016067 [Cardiocondyla obscurior]|uniref:Transmembrane protein n=1 Tax=Cardiocondyla obscurior TaxID=286306 RepID=A0AAW2EUK1_9HYME
MPLASSTRESLSLISPIVRVSLTHNFRELFIPPSRSRPLCRAPLCPSGPTFQHTSSTLAYFAQPVRATECSTLLVSFLFCLSLFPSSFTYVSRPRLSTKLTSLKVCHKLSLRRRVNLLKSSDSVFETFIYTSSNHLPVLYCVSVHDTIVPAEEGGLTRQIVIRRGWK